MIGRTRRTLASVIGVCALVSGAFVALGSPSASALTPITVLNNADSGAGSLRQAFIDAQAGNDDFEITIPAGVGDVTLTTGSLTYAGGVGGTHALTLLGGGNTITQTTPNDRVINNPGGGTLTVDNLTITGGVAPAGQSGGGIRASGGGSVVVTNSTITGNSAPVDGGGIFSGNGVTLTNSTVSGNTSTANGGGVKASGSSLTMTNSTINGNHSLSDSGGGAHVEGPLTMTDSTISGNDAVHGGGVFAGGGATVTGSTISNNTAGALGGGLHFDTSGTVTNSTISGNTAGNDAGGVLADAPLSIQYATIVGNTSPGSSSNIDFRDGDTLTSFGSVIALPLGAGANCDGQPFTNSSGYNWDDDDSCDFGAGPGDHANAGDPNLGALGSNGGPTQTRVPQTGSGLIDQIPATSPCAGVNITVDQRGLPRPVTLGQFCDIGAVEVQAAVAADPLFIEPTFTG